MNFELASEVDQLCFAMKQADYSRGKQRALINNLFNGMPPYSPTEIQENNINVNVNFLEGTGIAHEARTQFYGAFLKPGRYFSCTTDSGPLHKRSERASVVTRQINRLLKDSLPYYECFRSKFALDVLHGVGPSVFRDQDHWCPQPVGIEDVMIPANTLLTMENVPFFAVYRSYTAPELIRLTRGPRTDPAWNTKLVDAILEWIDRETMALMGSNWPEVWSPEKAGERVKGDGFFGSRQTFVISLQLIQDSRPVIPGHGKGRIKGEGSVEGHESIIQPAKSVQGDTLIAPGQGQERIVERT
jgi:hypothetical protein